MNPPSAPRHRGYQRGKAWRKGSHKPWLELMPTRPLPRTHGNPFGFMNVPADRPLPLPFDHPLKEELAEVKRVRDSRRIYWAEMAVLLPQDMDNRSSYDYQRQRTEEAAAETKVEELAGLIALAERGFAVTRASSQPTAQPILQSETWEREREVSRRGQERHSQRVPHSNQTWHNSNSEQASSRIRQRALDGRGSKMWETHASKSVLCTDEAKSQAVNKWMNELGMSREEDKREHDVPMFIGDNGGRSICALSDNGTGSAPSDTSLTRESNNPRTRGAAKNPARGKQLSHAENVAQLDNPIVWTLEEELLFEEAEAENEAERLELGTLVSQAQERPPAVVLQPSNTKDHVELATSIENEDERSSRLLGGVLAELDREPEGPSLIVEPRVQSQGPPLTKIAEKDRALAAEVLKRLKAKRALAAAKITRPASGSPTKTHESEQNSVWTHIDEADPVQTIDMQDVAEDLVDQTPRARPAYDSGAVEAVEAMIHRSSSKSLTSLDASQLSQHWSYVTAQLERIDVYKIVRERGARVSASKIRLMNREVDYKQYLQELEAQYSGLIGVKT